MSHEIMYRRQFIKTGEGRIIPLVLMGSSNCTEYTYGDNGRSYERFARDWKPFFSWGPNMRIDRSPEELLAQAAKCPHDSEQFTSGGKWKYGKDMPSYVKSGLRTAMTLEELTGVNQSITVYIYGHVVCYKRGSGFRDSESVEGGLIGSTEALDIFLKKTAELIEEKKAEYDCYIKLDFSGDNPLPYKMKTRRIRKPNPETFWAIKDERGYFLRQVTGGRRSYAKLCYNAESAKPFVTEKAASNYITEKFLKMRFRLNVEAVFIS